MRHVSATGWIAGLRYENPAVKKAVDELFAGTEVRTFEDANNSLWLVTDIGVPAEAK